MHQPPPPATGALHGAAYQKEYFERLFGAGPALPAARGQIKPREELHQTLCRQLAVAGFAPSILRPAAHFDDGRYYLPVEAEIKTLYDRRPYKYFQSVSDIFDCEDFAYSFKAFSAAHHYLDPQRSDTLPFAIGLLWGEGFQGLDALGHTINFAALSGGGIMLIDTSPGGLGLKPLAPGAVRALQYAII